MDFIDQLRQFSKRVESMKDSIQTEEATKTAIIMPFFAMLGLILAAVAGYGTYFAVQGSYVEYEYTFTNGELDVDKIVAKKKRTAMVSTDIKKFTAFGKYTDGMDESEDMTVVIASDNIASHEYYADFQHEEYGLTRLIFAPDERILDNIKKSLPPQLKRELNI